MAQGTWSSIIAAVKTPLGFFSLIVLVLESFLGALALKSPAQTYLVAVFAAVLVLLILVVALTTFYQMRVDELQKLKENEAFAAGVAAEIYEALDGSLRNLSSEDRGLAYDLLRSGMTNSPHAKSKVEKDFFVVLVETIIHKAKQRGEWGEINPKDS